MNILLSKSKKAILIYPGDGSVYMTSVAWMEMLLAGKARGNMIMLQEMKGATDNGIGSVQLTKDIKDKKKAFNFEEDL